MGGRCLEDVFFFVLDVLVLFGVMFGCFLGFLFFYGFFSCVWELWEYNCVFF